MSISPLFRWPNSVNHFNHPAGMPQVTAAQVLHRHTRWDCWVSHRELPVQYSRQTRGSFKHPCPP
ncbi:hypothetical protein C0X90_27540 [Escherichia coli O119]|nr:hypothetical protein [Escherichia coli O119]